MSTASLDYHLKLKGTNQWWSEIPFNTSQQYFVITFWLFSGKDYEKQFHDFVCEILKNNRRPNLSNLYFTCESICDKPHQELDQISTAVENSDCLIYIIDHLENENMEYLKKIQRLNPNLLLLCLYNELFGNSSLFTNKAFDVRYIHSSRWITSPEALKNEIMFKLWEIEPKDRSSLQSIIKVEEEEESSAQEDYLNIPILPLNYLIENNEGPEYTLILPSIDRPNYITFQIYIPGRFKLSEILDLKQITINYVENSDFLEFKIPWINLDQIDFIEEFKYPYNSFWISKIISNEILPKTIKRCSKILARYEMGMGIIFIDFLLV